MAMPQPAAGGRLAAWAVHLFTATGVVIALLAIAAVERGDLRGALLWLLAALVIDGVDGALARGARVAERLPQIDGAALDLIIDYLNYVLVPALLILKGGFLPEALAVPLCAAILVSALYVFVRRDMKTDDGYFRGFPALWNVVAFYFVLVPIGEWLAAGIVAGLVVLTFAPVHVVHPFRAEDSKLLAPAAATVWAFSTLIMAANVVGDAGRGIALGLSLGSLLVLTAIGLLRTARGSEH
jgi:phosphatidylcholine synthase